MKPVTSNAPLADRFRRAVFQADLPALRRLLEGEPAARELLDAPLFHFGAPALLHAAQAGNPPLVELLLEFGADPNRRSDWWAGGFHALHQCSGAVAERLIAAGAELDACAAAHLDRVEVLRRILDAEPERVRERGGDGQTPLHFARSREAVELLLARGAELDARDLDHRSTPAQWMCDPPGEGGRRDLARYLVDLGAETDVFLAAALGLTGRLRELLAADPSLLRLRTGEGAYGAAPPASFHIYTWKLGQHLTPLQVAIRFGQEEAAALLLEHASLKDHFLIACGAADRGEVERILAAKPGIVGELTLAEMRELPDAAWAGNVEAVTLMLSLGFDPAARGQDGGTALHCAAWQGWAECVEVVLSVPAAAALIEDRDPMHGSTPLGWCCHGARHRRNPKGDYPRVARRLLEAGAKVGPNLEDAPEEVRGVLEGWGRG